MVEKVKLLIRFLFLLTATPLTYGQSHTLPEPGIMASSPPPPVGLPLPIDDYLPVLMLAGVIYGVIKIPKSKKT